MATQQEPAQKPRFAPKEAVELDPPKDDPILLDYLSHCTGKEEGYPTLVAIKGIVFDVSKNEVYSPGKGYNVFAGRDASAALGKSSLKEEDCISDYSGLSDSERQTLDDWMTFFKYASFLFPGISFINGF